MTTKRVLLAVQARREIRETTAWYRGEGGAALAKRWATAVEVALRHISANPKTGSTRYAAQLKLDELRFWPVKVFPYLVFYIEREQHIDVGRVLHEQRDIPAWMGERLAVQPKAKQKSIPQPVKAVAGMARYKGKPLSLAQMDAALRAAFKRKKI